MTYKRKIFLGLMAAIAICSFAFWIRSYWQLDALHWTNTRTFLNLASTSGRVRITFTRWPLAHASASQWSASSRQQATTQATLVGDPQQQFAGFQWDDSVWRARPRTFSTSLDHVVAIPYWALCTLLCLPLAPSCLRWIRGRHRLHRGSCPTCGYDLRANTDRCSECGSAIRRGADLRNDNSNRNLAIPSRMRGAK